MVPFGQKKGNWQAAGGSLPQRFKLQAPTGTPQRRPGDNAVNYPATGRQTQFPLLPSSGLRF